MVYVMVRVRTSVPIVWCLILETGTWARDKERSDTVHQAHRKMFHMVLL